jgi:hypothetical protein
MNNKLVRRLVKAGLVIASKVVEIGVMTKLYRLARPSW